MQRQRRFLLLLSCVLFVPTVYGEKTIRRVSSGTATSFIVTLNEDAVPRDRVPAVALELANAHSGRVGHLYSQTIRGFSVRMPEERAKRLLDDPRVSSVHEDGIPRVASGPRQMQSTAVQSSPSWNLDRIDQDALPWTGSYTYYYTGAGIRVYVVDTGVNPHQDFGARLVGGRNFHQNQFGVVDPNATGDCYGHGTSTASIIGGTMAGVAKGVSLFNVRVHGCIDGDGPDRSYVSDYIAGIDWVTGQKNLNPAQQTVINMSLQYFPHSPLDDAVIRAISAGITFVVAAGNDNGDACEWSPGRLGNPSSYPVNPNGYSTITVGASTQQDQRRVSSNYGTCVDIFAPGDLGMLAAENEGYTSFSTDVFYNTSAAAPHVAGVAALHLEREPGMAPSLVESRIRGYASRDKLTNIGTGSPNLLLYTFYRKTRACCS